MKDLKLLLVEDSPDDARLILRELKKADYTITSDRVDTPEAMAAALRMNRWDLIISDYHMPQFSGIEALEQVKASGLDIPFIIVSGNIGEETAVSAMKAGADDYLMKDNLARLAPAIEKALRETENRRERRQAEQRIYENEAQLEAFFNSSIQAIFLIDKNLQIRRFNRVAREHSLIFVGKEPQEGDSMLDFIQAESVNVFKANSTRCLNGKVIIYEHPVEYADKGVRWYQVKYYPVYDRDSTIMGVAYSTLDITRKKHSELELQELRLRLEGIITSAMDAILTVDQQQNIIMFNQAAEQMFGYGQDQIIGKSLHVLIPERFRVTHNQYISQFDELGKTTRQMGTNLLMNGLHASGSEFPIEASISQVEVAGKKYLTVILRDISLRLLAEKQEKQLNQELSRQNEQLQQFGFITSHNIRGPVASLLGLTNLFNHENLNDPYNSVLVKNISTTVAKLDGVIRDLNQILDYKRDIGQVKEMVNLAEVFENVCITISQWIEEADCQIEVSFSEAPEVFAIKSYVQSIFYNLLSNAIKFRNTRRPLRVEVQSFRQKENISIRFRDNGSGIDLSKYRTQIFGLYKRFHLHVDGKGLGLHLIKTQIEAMNGSIEAESAVDKGTAFLISLPDEPGTKLW
jgi:PAS domain S-box-containing protein